MSSLDNKTWISERKAADMIKLPVSYLRKAVLAGSLKGLVKYLISRGYSYIYNKIDLANYMYENPNLAGL